MTKILLLLIYFFQQLFRIIRASSICIKNLQNNRLFYQKGLFTLTLNCMEPLTSGSLLCDHLTELYVYIYLTEPCLNITDYRLNCDWFNKTQSVYFVSKSSNTDWFRLYQ